MVDASQSLEDFIHRLPKVELHLHLEGAVSAETLRELAGSRRRLRKRTEAWIRDREREGYRYRNFQDFLVAFGLVSLLLEGPADYALATRRLIENLAAQNVRYAEIIFAAGVILWKKQPMEAVFDAIAEAAAEATSRTGVRVRWIFDAVRHFGVEHVGGVLKWAVRFRERGVVGFGIGGDEQRGPAERFTEIFGEARRSGLHLVAHAGEASGPESVRNAVELLGAERIGHGLAAARDPEVMALLRERRIPLEVCPSSNVSTGVLARFEDHPLPRFLDAGLVVTLNTDDPAMFGTSLEEEFLRTARAFGLSRQTLTGFCANAIQAAFLDESEKQLLWGELREAGESCAGSAD